MQEMQKNSIENNDDENVPLTKTKKSIEKPNLKKIRSDKQIEAFNKTMQIRKEKVEERKQAKLLESAKLLLEKTTLKKDIPSKKITPLEKYTDSYEDDSTVETISGEDTEEEIIVVKNKPKSKPKPKEKHKKKPSRKTIIFDSSSESSSDSSGGSSEEYIKAPKRISHERVKRKEVIEQPPIKQISKPEDFRVYFV
jgi:hypothetical protein